MRRVPEELRRRPFTLEEARSHGLTRRQLQSGSFRRIGPGIYVHKSIQVTPRMLIDAFKPRLPPEVIFAGLTAAFLGGVDMDPCSPLEGIVAPEIGVSARAGVVLRRARLPAGDVVYKHGVAITSMPRTLADISLRLPLVEAVVIADDALHKRLVSLAQLEAYVVDNWGRKGVGALRKVLRYVEPETESQMETRLRMLLVLGGLPRPEVQVPVYDDEGSWIARPDLFYPEQRVAIEYSATSIATSSSRTTGARTSS